MIPEPVPSSLPETSLFKVLLMAMQQPLSKVPMSYFDVVTDPITGASHTVIVIATDIYRRCSINDGPVSVHSLMQCGCSVSIVAETLMKHLLQLQSAHPSCQQRLNKTCTRDVSLDDGQLQTPLIPYEARTSMSNDLLTEHVTFDTWLLRMCYVPRSALAALHTALMASPLTHELPTSIPRHILPPAGLHTVHTVRPSIDLEDSIMNTDESRRRCKCFWNWWLCSFDK